MMLLGDNPNHLPPGTQRCFALVLNMMLDRAERADCVAISAAIAKRCEECGMSIVAEVEWNASERAGGKTVALAEGSSFAIRLVNLAADVRGNIDSMIIALRKSTACGNSIFMRIIDRELAR